MSTCFITHIFFLIEFHCSLISLYQVCESLSTDPILDEMKKNDGNFCRYLEKKC